MVKIYRGIRKMKKNNFKIVELKPTKTASTVKRTVFIKDFIIKEIIGFYKHEKIKKQKIKFNVVLNVSQDSVPDEKNIKSIVDYEKITNTLENLTKSKKYNFLESLAEDSFEKIFEDKRIYAVTIKIEKLEAIKNAKSVGVEVFKTRKDYEGS